MSRRTPLLLVLFLLLVASAPAPAPAAEQTELDQAFAALQEFDWGDSGEPLDPIKTAVRAAHDDEGLRAKLENRLTAVLKSDAPRRAKDYACRKLRHVGSAASVPALAAVLTDPELSHMARYALEPMPSPAAGAALREALDRTEGDVKVGIINSLGARREEGAVPTLIKLTDSRDDAVMHAAVAALGDIANARSIEALRHLLSKGPEELRDPVLGALARAADRARDQGRSDVAGDTYELLYSGEIPTSLRAGAFRGLMLTRGERGMEVLGKTLKNPPSPAIGAAALQLARELPGERVTNMLTRLLGDSEAETKAEILEILADRGDPAALGAVLQAAEHHEQKVRVAALHALGHVGDETVVPMLARTAVGGDGPERTAAREALNSLTGPDVNKTMIVLAARSPADFAAPLMRSLADRAASETAPMLMDIALHGKEERKRVEALRALSTLADDELVDELVRLAAGASEEGVRRASVGTLSAVCRRSDDRAHCAEEIVGGLDVAPVSARVGLLKVLGPLGGPKALDALRNALDSEEAEVRDAAVRALAETPDTNAAPDLLEVARSASSETHRVLALRGYVRLVGAMKGASPEEKTKMLGQALKAANRPEEKRAALAQLGKVPTRKALDMALEAMEGEQFREEAASAVVAIAGEIAGSEPDAATRALTRVQQVAASENVLKEARRALAEIRKHEGYVQVWQVAGPYSADGMGAGDLFEMPFPPETDPESADWQNVRLVGAEEISVNLSRILGGHNRAAYMRAFVHSEESRPARLEIGSDDGVKVWLNGEVVHENNTNRGLEPGEDVVEVELQKGWNELLLKVTQAGGGWAACARIAARNGTIPDGLRYQAQPPE